MDRKDRKKSKGILKKISGKWTPVIVAGGLLVGGGSALLTNDDIRAQANTAAVTMMSTINGSEFESKDALLEEESVQDASQEALDNITANWEANSVKQVQNEIERQREEGINTYIVQWGDTLEVLSDASGQSIEQISGKNNIGNLDLILTGDILTGIIEENNLNEESQIEEADQDETEENEGSSNEENQVSDDEEQTNGDEDQSSDESDSDDENIVEDPIGGTPTPTSDDESVEPIDEEETGKPVVNGGDDSGVPDEGVTETYRETRDILHGTRYIEDETLPEGEKVVEKEGSDGELIITFTETTFEDGSVEREEIFRDETPAEDEVVHIGTKEEVETTTETAIVEEVIPYEAVEVPTDELPEGKTEVDQEGQNGSRTITYEVTNENGEEVDREKVSSELTQKPVNKVVYVGTGKADPEPEPEPEVTEDTRVETNEIPYDTREVQTADLPEGESQIAQEGVHGSVENHYAITFEDGVEVNRELVDEVVTQEPVEEIVYIGTGQTEEEQPSDEENIENESPENEEQAENEIPEEEQTPENEIETVVETETVTQDIVFETTYTENSDVTSGEEQVIQEGQNGIRTVTYEVTYEEGVEVDRQQVSDEVTQEPVDQVVEVGTKEAEVVTETETEAIPHGTERIENSESAEGEDQVIQEGQDGVRTITYEVTYENGEEVGRQEVGSEVTQEPVNEVIEFGTATDASFESVPVSNVEYSVEHGDTLYSIAINFGTTMESIRSANRLSTDTLSSGQTLIIPTAQTTPMDIPQSYDNRQVVMIDPGHGGRDSGASGHGETEENINLEISNRLRDNLTERGYEVIMTRDGDIHLTLENRAQLANESDADLFISVHQNAFNESANGIETFYYDYSTGYPSTMNEEYHNDEQRIANSKYIADLVQENLIENTGANDRGVKNSSFAVLRETDIPAILVETGFIDNSQEADSLGSAEYQESVADAIADAVDTYFSSF